MNSQTKITLAALAARVSEDHTEAVPLKQSEKINIDSAQLTSGGMDVDRKQSIISPLIRRPRRPLDAGDDVRNFQAAADAVHVT